VCLVYNVLRIWEISVMIYACIVDHTDIKLKASYLHFEWGKGEGFLVVVNG